MLPLGYPALFLTARGHNYEYSMKEYIAPIFSFNSDLSVEEHIIALILEKSFAGANDNLDNLTKSVLAIPKDLIDTVLELNGKIKNQVVSKADREKYDRYTSDPAQAKRKGYFIGSQILSHTTNIPTGVQSHIAPEPSSEDPGLEKELIKGFKEKEKNGNRIKIQQEKEDAVREYFRKKGYDGFEKIEFKKEKGNKVSFLVGLSMSNILYPLAYPDQ